MIYFIQPTAGGHVKIGQTIRLAERLIQLQRELGIELCVLAVTDGGRTEETALHRRFSHLRKNGEWFDPSDDLMEFISQECRSWDGTVEISSEFCTVKVDRDVVAKAKMVAVSRGISLMEYLTRIVAERVDSDLERETSRRLGPRKKS